tara:strand:+ start:678 stop:956 length:279 start_codon:yes stop_codon:yes gene_type:complete
MDDVLLLVTLAAVYYTSSFEDDGWQVAIIPHIAMPIAIVVHWFTKPVPNMDFFFGFWAFIAVFMHSRFGIIGENGERRAALEPPSILPPLQP